MLTFTHVHTIFIQIGCVSILYTLFLHNDCYLIVAEKARSCTGYNLTFLINYLKFGFISTLIVLFSGLPLVYFTGRHVNKC